MSHRHDDGYQESRFDEGLARAKTIAEWLKARLEEEKFSARIYVSSLLNEFSFTIQRVGGELLTDEQKTCIRSLMLSDECRGKALNIFSTSPFSWKNARFKVGSRQRGNLEYVWSLEKRHKDKKK